MENENSNRGMISLAFVLMGFLVFLTVSILFEAAAGAFGPVARLYGQELYRHGIPVGTGLITFAFLNFHPKVVNWADEVVTEIRKVVWPSRKDTVAMTIVVCIMVLVSGMGLGLFDWVSSQAVKMFVNVNKSYFVR
jgi:preprotein translocase subunit SecE